MERITSHLCGIIFALLSMLSVLEGESHYFELPSGMVTYRIDGGGALTAETNLTLEGNATLQFQEWGVRKREEEQGRQITSGAITYTQHVHRMQKSTAQRIVTVDFANEQLLERKRPDVTSSQKVQTEGLQPSGRAEILGYPCQIWVGPGVSKCIHKGVVLRQDAELMGITYTRVATKIDFDLNSSVSRACDLPDFPLQHASLYRKNIKTKNIKNPQNFCSILKDVASETELPIRDRVHVTMEDKVRIAFINSIGQGIFLEYKAQLLAYLEGLKALRVCFVQVQGAYPANLCLEKLNTIKAKLAMQSDTPIVLWSEESRAQRLDRVEEELLAIESRFPCIRRAKNITDLSRCMR